MEVSLFDALTVVALGVGQTKQSLLQKRAGIRQHYVPLHGISVDALFFVPEGERNVLQTVCI